MPFNFGHVTSVLMLCVVALTAVGTAGPQFNHRRDLLPGVRCNRQFFLYQSRDVCDGYAPKTMTYSRAMFPCMPTYDKLTNTFSFAIVACAFGFVTAIIAMFSAFIPRIPSLIPVILVLVTLVCLTITWPVSESVRTRSQCGELLSYKDVGYQIDWGLICLITAWCLCFVVGGLAVTFGICPRFTRAVVVVKRGAETLRVDEGDDSFDDKAGGEVAPVGGFASISGVSPTMNAPDNGDDDDDAQRQHVSADQPAFDDHQM